MKTSAESLVEIGKINELQSGQMKMVQVGEHQILLARVDSVYYAAENLCPHMGGDLSEGKLEGTIVTCPRHGSQFDLKDGQVVRWTTWPGLLVSVDNLRSHRRSLRIYSIFITGDSILINL